MQPHSKEEFLHPAHFHKQPIHLLRDFIINACRGDYTTSTTTSTVPVVFRPTGDTTYCVVPQARPGTDRKWTTQHIFIHREFFCRAALIKVSSLMSGSYRNAQEKTETIYSSVLPTYRLVYLTLLPLLFTATTQFRQHPTNFLWRRDRSVRAGVPL